MRRLRVGFPGVNSTLTADAGSFAVSGVSATLTPSGTLTWQFTDGATLNTGSSQTTELATNVPPSAVYYASPDLLPGQTLELSGTTLNLVGDSTVPTVNGSTSGSPLDAISDRDVYIEVMDSPLARARNLRYPLVWWGVGESGAIDSLTGGRGRLSNVLRTTSNGAATYPCLPGDTIEISPGAVAETPIISATSAQSSCYLPVTCSVTLKNIDGRGRWRLLPDGADRLEGTAYDAVNGIVVNAPSQAHLSERIALVVQGCEMMNFGRSASAIRVFQDSVAVSPSWAKYAASLTLQDFKLGMPTGEYSYSVLSGTVEDLSVLDGEIVNGGDNGGQEHGAYISARNMLWRGVRVYRTFRPNDGHILKLTSNNCTIEGCVIDGGPEGDQSYLIQNKGGGNLVVRGCLFYTGQYSASARGAIGYVREQPGVNDGGWSFGLSGHSLLVERNVFINHMAAGNNYAAVYFAPAPPASGSGEYLDPALVSSAVVRHNIANSTTGDANLIKNAPASLFPSGGGWATNNNTALTYSSSESHWTDDEKRLKLYRLASPISAGSSLSTYRCLWPHGSMVRTDSFQGLG